MPLHGYRISISRLRTSPVDIDARAGLRLANSVLACLRLMTAMTCFAEFTVCNADM